jgi:hypothetical protein
VQSFILSTRRRLRPLKSARTIGLRLGTHDPPCSVSAEPAGGKIVGEPHPVDAAEQPMLGQTVSGIEHHVLAVVQRILRKLCLGMAMLPSRTILS